MKNILLVFFVVLDLLMLFTWAMTLFNYSTIIDRNRDALFIGLSISLGFFLLCTTLLVIDKSKKKSKKIKSRELRKRNSLFSLVENKEFCFFLSNFK